MHTIPKRINRLDLIGKCWLMVSTIHFAPNRGTLKTNHVFQAIPSLNMIMALVYSGYPTISRHTHISSLYNFHYMTIIILAING